MRGKGAIGVAAILSFMWTALAASQEAQPQQASPQAPDPFHLALILKAGREYSQRLGGAALDFVCVEEVTDRIDLSRDGPHDLFKQVDIYGGAQSMGSTAARIRLDRDPKSAKGTSVYVFDYQFVRQAGKVKESRTLLKKNGKDAKPDDPIPQTAVFQYADILMAPVQVLDESIRDFYRYRLLREDALGEVKCWVVEVAPSFALREETRRGLEVIRSGETSEGASRFSAGAGRHGDFS